ncbi:MAG: response regulator [Hymenobacter sp.]|nr:MAG: response regulator [Hymenobacter sp.]
MTLHPTITVLIIDDDDDDRFFMQNAFEADSPTTQVQLAVDGQAGLDWLSAADDLPDVVLLDLNMPGLTGFEVLKQLKQSSRWRAMPVVILTTSDSPIDQQQARQLGATQFITKPTTHQGLATIAEQIRLKCTG